MNASAQKVFFPGLNGLRFFAALAVVFTHVELMKKFMRFGSHWIDMALWIPDSPIQAVLRKDISWLGPLIANSGPLGVVFFFVLSGFLITYLLFEEKNRLGDIAIGKFYLRRILRIWPLYYFVMFLGFFVLPHFHVFDVPRQIFGLNTPFWENFWLYLFFFPNLAFAMFVGVPNIGQLWSIGVEEQFYLVWPVLMRYVKKPLVMMLGFCIGLVLLKAAFLLVMKGSDATWVPHLKKFLAMLKLECMAIGGIGAYFLYFKKEKWLAVIYHPATQLLSYLSIPLLVYCTPMYLQDGVHLLYAVAFLIIILNISCNHKTIINLEHPVLDYLGRISFGIYMYHMMCIVFTLHFLPPYMHLTKMDLNSTQNMAIYLMSTVLTILVASLSYHFFERRFIRMKKKVTRIESGDNPTD